MIWVEYDPSKMDKSSESIDELNAIAGGDYWQDIINQYKAGTIDGYEAEAGFFFSLNSYQGLAL